MLYMSCQLVLQSRTAVRPIASRLANSAHILHHLGQILLSIGVSIVYHPLQLSYRHDYSSGLDIPLFTSFSLSPPAVIWLIFKPSTTLRAINPSLPHPHLIPSPTLNPY